MYVRLYKDKHMATRLELIFLKKNILLFSFFWLRLWYMQNRLQMEAAAAEKKSTRHRNNKISLSFSLSPQRRYIHKRGSNEIIYTFIFLIRSFNERKQFWCQPNVNLF